MNSPFKAVLHSIGTGIALVASIAVAVPSTVYAQTNDWNNRMIQGIDAMQRLQVKRFSVVESQGRLFLISDNGQYVVPDVDLRDMWNGVRITSVADVKRSFAIPLDRMNIGDDDLGGIMIGKRVTGEPKPVTLFIDPASPETQKILPAVRQFASTYPFRLVFVPARVERNRATEALLCSREAAQEFVRTGVVPDVGTQDRCGMDATRKNIMLVQVLNIDSLPFLLASNGRASAGVPENLADFLSENVELVK